VDNLYKKALGWYQKGNLDKAGEEYKKVLSIEPKHVFALNNLGVIYMSRKGNKKAEDMFRKAIDLKADYVDPYYNLACLYSISGNISKSLYYLKIAVSINNSVKNWAKNDKDLEGLRMSETYKKIME
jgi:Flp pilus assembly protein TadD